MNYLLPAAILIAFFALFYWQAPSFYKYHKRLSEEDPKKFQTYGIGKKYISDETRWVKHYRRYIVIIGLVVFAILLTYYI